MHEDSDSWFPDALCVIIGVVLGVLASNTVARSMGISGTVSIFAGLACGVVLVGMHFRESCLARFLQILAATILTVIIAVGK